MSLTNEEDAAAAVVAAVTAAAAAVENEQPVSLSNGMIITPTEGTTANEAEAAEAITTLAIPVQSTVLSPSSSSSSTASSPARPPLSSMEPRERIICTLSHTIKHFEIGSRPNDQRRRRRGNCKECVVNIGSSKATETSYYCEECSDAAAHTVFLHPEHHLMYHVRNLSDEDKQVYSQIFGKTF